MNHYQHLVRNVPNNRLTRWLVHLFVIAMTRSESRFTIQLRYRKPRKGFKYGWCGNLEPKPVPNETRDEHIERWTNTTAPERGKTFSIYIVERQSYTRAQARKRHDEAALEQHIEELKAKANARGYATGWTEAINSMDDKHPVNPMRNRTVN